MPLAIPTDQEKAAVRKAYQEGRPTRVPVTLSTNARVVLLNRQWNAEGWTFEQAATDPRTHIAVALQHELYRRTVLSKCMDEPTALPDVWAIGLNVYNVYEAAFFGAAIDYTPNQVPDTIPPLADEDRKHEVFDIDVEHPLDNPFIRDRMAFWREMEAASEGMTFEGRPVKLGPWTLCGSDGPVTVACNLRGADNFMMDMVADPDYADRLMGHITQASIHRRRAFEGYWGDRIGRGNGLADDSCVLISNQMYADQVLKHHRAFYEAQPDRPRSMHMCGDATRLFPMMHEQLNVVNFDTGFPVDFGQLREQLGDDVAIQGGPEVALLLNGTPQQVYDRAKGILRSGVMRGGKFLLREGNNLPPNVPEGNLQAMYTACLEHGRHES